MWARLSLKAKLTILVVLIVSGASFVFLRFAGSGLVNLLTKAEGEGAVTAAEGLISQVDTQWLTTVNPQNGSDDHWRALEEQFSNALAGGYVRRIALYRIVGKDEVETIINLPHDDTQDYNPPGYREHLVPGTPYLSHPVGYDGVNLSVPGAYVAGWAPLSLSGKQVGVLLVVIDSNEVQDAINTINIALMAVLGALIILAGLTSYKFSATFEKTAVTDGLMGIYNHKFFKQRLEQEVSKSARYGQQTSLVMLDIDFFKKVNDTYGHATGDLVLKQLARWVSDSSRNTDVVARYGGEEIGIILTHTGLAGAQEFAERLRMKVSQQVIKDPEEDAEFRVTVSIGVAQWEKGVNMLDLIKRADAALYHSKHTGRNRVTIYQDDILPGPDQPQTKTGS